MRKKRINSISGIKSTTKRTRTPRSFTGTTSHLAIRSSTSVKRRKPSDGIKKRKKSLVHVPVAPIEIKKTSQRRRQETSKSDFQIISLIKQNWFWLQYLVKIGLVLLGIFLFFNAREKTVITLRPHHEYLEIDQLIKVFKSPQEDQLGFDIIAISDKVSVPIIAEGVRDVRLQSSGIITLYNNYSSEPQRLLPGTRLESAGGKIFKLGNEEVILPGKKDNEPGKINVTVFADQSGSDYNIDITDFTIPGFKEAGLDAKYNGIYGVSTTRFKGGEIGTEPYVLESQRAAAEVELINLLNDRLAQRLAKEKTDNLYLIKNSTQVKSHDAEYIIDKEQGVEMLTKRGTIFGLVIGGEAISSYIEIVFNDKETDNEFTVKNINNINFELSSGDFNYEEDSSFSATMSGSPLIVNTIDEKSIINSLQGKARDVVPSILEGLSEVDRAEIIFRPFWKKMISQNVILRYE